MCFGLGMAFLNGAQRKGGRISKAREKFTRQRCWCFRGMALIVDGRVRQVLVQYDETHWLHGDLCDLHVVQNGIDACSSPC